MDKSNSNSNSNFDDTLRNVVNDGLLVCLNAYENIHTNLYLLLQHLRCLVEDTRDSGEYEQLNNALYSFYAAISASHKCLLEVDEPIKEIAEWLDFEEDDIEDED